MKIEEEKIFPYAVTVVLNNEGEYEKLKELEASLGGEKEENPEKECLTERRANQRAKIHEKKRINKIAKKDSWLKHKDVVKKAKELGNFTSKELIKSLDRPMTASIKNRISVHISKMVNEGLLEKGGKEGIYTRFVVKT